MFEIDSKSKTINITRGDVASFKVSANEGRKKYVFKNGDIVRFRILKYQDYNTILKSKDVQAVEGETEVQIDLIPEDTRISEIKSKAEKYFYEIELNPDTVPQTIIGYDKDGAKIINIYPEGADING